MTSTQVALQVAHRLPPFSVPSEDHPLHPLVIHYLTLREMARDADRQCETIAPTPYTMAGDHPADALTGHDRDHYMWLKHKRDNCTHAAKMAHRALCAVVDNLGGL
jgi:hypothetical protein